MRTIRWVVVGLLLAVAMVALLASDVLAAMVVLVLALVAKP